jgi:hypothetical protein
MKTCCVAIRWWRPALAAALLLGLELGGLARAASPPVTNSLSLTARFPREKLTEILLPRDRWRPFPALKDREGWQALPKPVAGFLVTRGERALAKPLPPLPATLYLGYAREGNRSRFENVYFERRTILEELVLAECAESKGRFLDAIADALWAICEESTWCLPAHIAVQKARVGLPDISEPIVDLFAAETGVTVAWTLFLAGAELERVSPQLTRRARLELQHRILAPVLTRSDFGWMALNVTSPAQRPNNWTPWIAASVLTTALLEEADASHRVSIVEKMMRSVDAFLRFHPADGGCDEGPGYWARAGGSLLDCLDLLHSATGGKADVFGEPLVQEIGRFIYRAHIAGDYYVPIGDCAARLTPDRSLVFRYGKRIQDPRLQGLAASGASVESLLGGRFLGRLVFAVFEAGEVLSFQPATPPLARDVWLGSEDLQLMAARSRAGSAEGLYVAAWGAHNAQSHNHNDVGNVLVFADGQPVFVDAGAPTYTAQTFSSKRYEHWAFQSAFHNLPTINGVMQGAGRQFAARNVICETNDAVAQLEMDIAGAYPAEARVKSWVRSVKLNRGREVELTETFELAATAGETTLNFLTPLVVDTTQAGRVALRGGSEGGKPATSVHLDYDATKLAASVERVTLSDGNLKGTWGDHLNRLILRAKSPVLKDAWTLRVARD